MYPLKIGVKKTFLLFGRYPPNRRFGGRCTATNLFAPYGAKRISASPDKTLSKLTLCIKLLIQRKPKSCDRCQDRGSSRQHNSRNITQHRPKSPSRLAHPELSVGTRDGGKNRRLTPTEIS